jgi:DNA repair protein RecN (Recombination protein N)
VENRLNTYNRLKDKYGNTVEEILSYRQEKEERVLRLEDYDAYIARLEQEKENRRKQLADLCGRLSALRIKQGKKLQKEWKQALLDLNFMSVDLQVQVIPNPQALSGEGCDDVDFLISLNPGEPVLSISRVASGGELSRIMLALKAVMADKEKIMTLIFDEIDAGISGKTAWKVSEKMAVLGKDHQLLCITHLPQIAAMADTHFVIEKHEEKGRSITAITEIKGDEVLRELARLLGGDEVTDAVLANARELKEMAAKRKCY